MRLPRTTPTIKPYDEKAWAKLADARMPVEVSLALLDSVHARWVALCRDLKPTDWARTFIHPGYPEGPRTIDWLVQIYAWHSRHHRRAHYFAERREGWLA